MKRKLCQTIVCLLLATAVPCRPATDPTDSGPTAPGPAPQTSEEAERLTELETQVLALRDQGHFAEAVPPAREILESRQRIQGSDHWETADARRRLATFERVAALPADQRLELGQAFETFTRVEDLNGRHQYEDALELTRGQLATFQRVLGDEHQATLSSISTLADLLYSLGQREETEQLFRQVLTALRTTVGEDHPSTIRAVHNLGAALTAQGKLTEAEPYMREALDYFRRTMGDDHPKTLSSINNMGYLLEDLGRLDEAEAHYREALAGRRRVLGDGNSQTLNSVNNLGLLMMNQGHLSEAESLLRESLEGRRRSLGDDHRRTLTAINNLGLLFIKQGRLAEAEPLCRRALEARRRLLGDEHRRTLTSVNNLGLLMMNQGCPNEAEPLYSEALEGSRRVLGDEHPNTLRSTTNLGVALNALGRQDEAEQLFRRALDCRSRTLGETHGDTLLSMNRLGLHLLGRGRFDESGPLLRRALEQSRTVLGEEHPVTLISMQNLALQFRWQNRLDESEQLLREALAGRRPLGETHPTVTRLLSGLAELQEQQANFKGARATWTEAARSFESSRLQVSFDGLERAHYAARNSPLPSLAACLARAGEPTAAWRHFEENLARGLLDTLSARHSRPLDDEERNRETDLLGRVEQIDERISASQTAEAGRDPARAAELRRERDTLQSQLVRFEAELANKYGVAAGEVYPLSRIQAALPADAALLGWVDTAGPESPGGGPGEHWACVVRRTGDPAWVRLPGSGPGKIWTTEDDGAAGELRDKLNRWGTGPADRWQMQDLIRRVEAQRLAPLADRLKGVKRLIVLPAGRMHGIPLEVLTHEYTVSYAPSGTMYAWLREAGGQTGKPASTVGRLPLLALGDPLFGQPDTSEPTQPTPPNHGVLVAMVAPDSNALRSGLAAGDILLRYGDQTLAGPDDLAPAIEQAGAAGTTEGGNQVPLTVWRQGETLEIPVAPGKLGVRPAREPAPLALRSRERLDAALELTRGGSYRALPHTRIEVEKISRLFPAGPDLAQPIVLLGAEASEQRLQELAGSGELKKFRFIHLATHGEMDDQRAMRSALILAQHQLPDSFEQVMSGEEIHDGRLTGDQIIRSWRLDAELVTLSGCRTALGKESGGEGCLGFAQAFFVAGARSLLLSLWQVEDRATMLLMTRFYENLLGHFEETRKLPGQNFAPGNSMSKAEALREAKQWLRNLTAGELQARESARSTTTVVLDSAASETRPFANPRYWAAFILLGE